MTRHAPRVHLPDRHPVDRHPCVGLGLLLPLFLLAAVAVVLCLTQVDLIVQRRLWDPVLGWRLAGRLPWQLLYHYGPWPALALAIGSLCCALVAIGHRPWRRHAKAAWFFVLTMLLGPGLLVNTVFKKEWGRPRPKQLIEFGGTQHYAPWWRSTPFSQGRSFPSGHASTGFFLMTPWFLLRRRRPARAALCLGAGLVAGGFIGWARMTQGGHFLTDVLWAGGMVYLSGWLVDRLLHFPWRPLPPPAPALAPANLAPQSA